MSTSNCYKTKFFKNLALSFFSIVLFTNCVKAHDDRINGFPKNPDELSFLENIKHHQNLKDKMPPPPNTVKGVKENAKEGDYSLLRGVFTRKLEKYIFEFKDEKGDSLEVSFEGVQIPLDLTFNYPYFLWGCVLKNDEVTVIQAQFLSPKL